MADEWRKRKRSSEGSIKQVGSYLYARIQWIDPSTGKRREKVRRAINRTDARKLIKEMAAELAVHGQDTLCSDKLTFRELAAEYESKKLIPAVYSNGIKVAGKRSVLPSRSGLKTLVSFFGNRQVRSIRASEIEAFKVSRLATAVKIESRNGTLERPRKMASVNREIELLRAVLNFAKSEGLMIKTPFENGGQSLIVRGAEVERTRILSLEEEGRLLEACGPRIITYSRNGKKITARSSGCARKHLRALIIAAVDTAARRGELFKLRWKDVDLFAGVITIQASNSKTEKARMIPITQRLNIELRGLLELAGDNPEDIVFGITSTIKNAWRTLCDAAGLEDLRFHDLRHTATTRMIRAGLPHTEVMKITGHTQMMTFLRYLNLTHESLLVSASRLDAFLTAERAKVWDLDPIQNGFEH